MEELDFPPLFAEVAAPAQDWPLPPFAWCHRTATDDQLEQPCRVESCDGRIIEGHLTGFDPAAGCLTLHAMGGGEPRSIAFAQLRRLTLLVPLQSTPRLAGTPVERIPAAAQEREYRLQPRDDGPPLVGRTAGHVEAAEGLYLFSPMDEERSVQRVFVPRSAYAASTFGLSAGEIAAQRWISTPQALLEAVERQQRAPIMRMGQALLDLGLLTNAQLDRALAAQADALPLGETLVASGLISASDLQTALAHKMGYPCVDLNRFPIDPVAVRMLTLRTAIGLRAVPLLIDGKRLIVAVDRPARAPKLKGLRAFADVDVVPVLASREHIRLALARLADQDVWSHNVVATPPFFATTL